MRLPKWQKEFVRWDQYEAFHMGLKDGGLCQTSNWNYPTFVIFDDGQVWCRMTGPDPEDRRFYPDLNVTLVGTTDKDCPTLFTADGEQVKKAWLNDDGMQYLLIDHDSGRVVKLATRSLDELLTTTLPNNEKAIGAWFAGDKALPVGAPIALRKPFKTLSPEDQQKLDDFVCSTKAAMLMLDHPSTKLTEHHYPAQTNTWGTTPARTWTESPPEWKVPIKRVLEVDHWEDMSDEELKRLFFAGVADRPRELHDYLTINGGK